jgi:DNA gyrase/topoisomerase IV subunit A
MDQKLPKLYKDYGQYSNYRNFPLDIDGLKPVERRILLTSYKIARNKLTKSRKIDSYTTGNFHPHGDCYGSIVQLVRQGFLDGQGNFGSNVGVEPTGAAAPRYTECKLANRTYELAFKYIKYVNWIDTELDDKEPEFLPTMYPICLLGTEPTQGLGFGFKTYIPCYSMKDLHKRLLWLLGIRKRRPIIAPITDCIIKSSPEELDRLLTTGKAKIQVEGQIEIDTRNNTVILKSWPPGKRFESFLNKFGKELADGMIGFIDISSTETKIKFEVLRERNRDKIFNDFLKKLKNVIKGTISFETVVMTRELKVRQASIDEMLVNTYKMFVEINEHMLNEEKKRINEIILEYNALELIRKVLGECIQPGYDIFDTLDEIERATPVDRKTAEELIKKYHIAKLLTLDTDTDELVQQVQDLEDKLKNISEFVLSQYKLLK